MTSLLTTVAGEQLTMPLSPQQRHLFQSVGAIKAQLHQDWDRSSWNMTPLVSPNSTTGPGDQHQVISEGIGQAVRFAFTGALFPKSDISHNLPSPKK